MRALVPWFLVASLGTFAAAARTKEFQGHRDRLEAEIIPDLQLYPRDMEGPQELTPAQRDLLHGRVARCYDPRANRDYSDVQWQQALDQYMREEVSKGLKKVPRVVVTGMDMWGSHLPVTRQLPFGRQGCVLIKTAVLLGSLPNWYITCSACQGQVHASPLDFGHHPGRGRIAFFSLFRFQLRCCIGGSQRMPLLREIFPPAAKNFMQSQSWFS